MTQVLAGGVTHQRASDSRDLGGMMLHQGNAEVTCCLGSASFAVGHLDETEIRHETEEIMFIASGKGELATPEGSIAFAQGDALAIPAGVWHSIDNTGPIELQTVFTFPSPRRPQTRSRTRTTKAKE